MWTVTSFTAGHSVTLALASLGAVHVPQAPIEAAIALSIYVLAVELISARQGKRTLTHLPTAEIPLALFFFNIGIELGQLAFVGAVLLLLAAALRKVPVAWPQWAKAVPVYGIGAMAAFWFLQRAVSLM